jgi:hypothetical protein
MPVPVRYIPPSRIVRSIAATIREDGGAVRYYAEVPKPCSSTEVGVGNPGQLSAARYRRKSPSVTGAGPLSGDFFTILNPAILKPCFRVIA